MPALSRRNLLKNAVSAGGASVLLRALGVPLPAWGAARPYDGTLRDRLWMWGHDPGSLKKGYGIGSVEEDMRPGDAIKHMGIPNVCMVRFTGTPLPPFDDYVKQFADAKRLTWSFVDGATNYTTEQKKQQALELAATQPNLIGLDMDDFFYRRCRAEDRRR